MGEDEQELPARRVGVAPALQVDQMAQGVRHQKGERGGLFHQQPQGRDVGGGLGDVLDLLLIREHLAEERLQPGQVAVPAVQR